MAYDPTGAWPTLVDLATQLNPDGTLADIAQVFSLTDEMMKDIPWKEANGRTYHRITVEDGMPAGTWRKLNQGIKAIDSGTLQVDETIGLLEARSEVDLVLARMSKDIPKYRASKDNRIIRGMGQQVASAMIYGNTAVTPDRFHGLDPRFNVLGQKTNTFGTNNMSMPSVYSNGGTGGALSSVWLVGWGEDTVFGIYPQGSSLGMETEDLGIIDAADANGGKFRAYGTHFRCQQGLAVEDWRYVTRLANIDVTTAITDANLTILLNNLIDMVNTIPDISSCRPAFYMNRRVKSFLTKMSYAKNNLALAIGDVYGEKNVLNISGIPIRQSDSILLTETQIV